MKGQKSERDNISTSYLKVTGKLRKRYKLEGKNSKAYAASRLLGGYGNEEQAGDIVERNDNS